MSKLIFRYGAMNSAKTASALMFKYNFEERGLRVLLSKPAIDLRDGISVIKSRCGLEAKAVVFEDLNDDLILKHDFVIVDEVQFLNKDNIDYLIYIVDSLNKNVICYGLRTDFRGDLFEGSQYLLACADKIEELKTTCWCGKKAIHNARINAQGEVVRCGDQIELGGNDKYVALCRKHFMRGRVCV